MNRSLSYIKRKRYFKKMIRQHEQEMMESIYHTKEEVCPSCYGAGYWETECCSGAGGCSCRGGLVYMGKCNVCNGRGYVVHGHYNPRANSDFILRTGACFAGSGPSSGYWAGKPALNMPSRF